MRYSWYAPLGREALFRVDDQPGQRADDAERRGHQKRRGPSIALGDKGRDDRGDGAAGLRAHVHESGNRAGRFTTDVRGHTPERTLREIEHTGAAGEHQGGDLRAIGARSNDEEYGREGNGHGRDTATAGAWAARLGEAIVEHAADGAADGH